MVNAPLLLIVTASLGVVIAVFLLSALVGVFAADSKRPLRVVVKPFTTALLFVIVGRPQSRLAWLIDVGLVFSLVGDIALLWSQQKALMVGLASFLVTHVLYIVAFVGVAANRAGSTTGYWTPQVAGAAVILAIATLLLFRAVWGGAAGLRGPLVAYGLALGTMVVSALAASSVSGAPGISPLAAMGAVLFYVADASLALDRFHRPIKHAPVLTLGVYWLGQLGIALAAHFAAA